MSKTCEGEACLNLAQYQIADTVTNIFLSNKQTPQTHGKLIGKTAIVSVHDVKDSIHCSAGIQVAEITLS